jgi:hypothetical protein
MTFKPEYNIKLGSDKESFISNLKKHKRYNDQIIRQLNNAKTFKQFIEDAFEWKYTPERKRFWEKVSNR